jgi:tRNA-dihydrouridine synthase A
MFYDVMTLLNNTHSALQIAPMVDWTNSPFRLMMRLMLPKAKLFTEMLVPRAIIQAPHRFLSYYPVEPPLVLQLGGSEPDELLQAALIAENAGYDEINLNLGCPSERVQAGAFGACLMKEKQLVVRCLKHLSTHLKIPVTAKTRIGVDELDSYAFFQDFISGIVESGCREIIIHARKAWLKGLNPKQNRTIPTINYDFVYQIQRDFPDIDFIINGEIKTVAQMQTHLEHVPGVMLGRLACDNPFKLTDFHQYLFPDVHLLSRRQLISAYFASIDLQNIPKNRISCYLKPLFNLYHGTIYSKRWKQRLQIALTERNIVELFDYWSTELDFIECEV